MQHEQQGADIGSAFELVLVGDTSLGDAYLHKRSASAYRRRLETDPFSFFEALAPLISDKSFLIANLETVLAVSPHGPLDGRKEFLGWDTPKRTLGMLQRLGVDAVSLANNHTMDYGAQRLLEMISRIERSGIRIVGAGANLAEAARPLTISTQAKHLYIFAGFEVRQRYRDDFHFYATAKDPGVNPFSLRNPNELTAMIERTRQSDADAFVIVYPHWGGCRNYRWSTKGMRRANEAFFDAGANLVVGHGAHMLQECCPSRRGLAVFSLGNFVFNSPGAYTKNNAPPFSLVCRISLWRDASDWQRQLKLYPIVSDNRQTGYRPRPVNEIEARSVFALLASKVRTISRFTRNFELLCDKRGWHLMETKAFGLFFDGS